MEPQLTTIANWIADITLIMEVVFLFTCGQRYMKTQVIRNKRSFYSERLAYIAIAVASCFDLVLAPCNNLYQVAMSCSVAVLLLRKCISANRKSLRQRSLMDHRRTG